MNDALIDHLSHVLAGDEPVLLNTEERSLIRAALSALAESEKRVGHLRSVLAVQSTSLEQVENTATGSRPDFFDGPMYDFAAADAARATFEAKLRSASSTASVIAAALSFARDAAIVGS